MNFTTILRRQLRLTFFTLGQSFAIAGLFCVGAGSVCAQQQHTIALASDSQYNGSPPANGYSAVADLTNAPTQRLNINTATIEQLDNMLPGIGPEKARRIVEWRTLNGPFQSIDQLLEVSGIGPRTLERIRPYVLLGAAATTSSFNPAFHDAERQTRLAVQQVVDTARRHALEAQMSATR